MGLRGRVIPGGLGAFAILVAAVVLVLAMALVYLLSRDRDVAKTSFGFYVSRDRYEDELPFDPGETPTAPHEWPGQKPD